MQQDAENEVINPQNTVKKTGVNNTGMKKKMSANSG